MIFSNDRDKANKYYHQIQSKQLSEQPFLSKLVKSYFSFKSEEMFFIYLTIFPYFMFPFITQNPQNQDLYTDIFKIWCKELDFCICQTILVLVRDPFTTSKDIFSNIFIWPSVLKLVQENVLKKLCSAVKGSGGKLIRLLH